MRLTELDPRWFTFGNAIESCRVKLGITFECPHCRKERLGVAFINPIDPDSILPRTTWVAGAMFDKNWQREGETFDTLTISPSIDASGVGHWHGCITNGAIT